MDPRELVPLEGGLPLPYQSRRVRGTYQLSKSCFLGPLRLCRLLAFMFLLPSLFIFIPLYLRYRVYSGQMYPMSMTDMRLIDSKISTTWCQRQVVKSNATFNAFVVPGQPEMSQELIPVSMTRELELDDDMKEYWGFYLLKGSTVTVSACVSFPGASLIMIKGYKHLQECAYIGDDSSEELDELLEANRQGLLSNTKLFEKLMELRKEYGKKDDPEELQKLVDAHEQGQLNDATFIKKLLELKEDGKANNPETMKRQKAGVRFHDPSHSENVTSPDAIPNTDVTDQDPKELREILERLHAIRQAAKTESLKHYHPPDHLMDVPELHRHRNTNVDKDERKWITFKDIEGNKSNQQRDPDIINEGRLQKRIPVNLELNKDKLHKSDKQDNYVNEIEKSKNPGIKSQVENNGKGKESSIKNIEIENQRNVIESSRNVTDKTKDTQNNVPETTVQVPNSKEVFEDVLKKLQSLGDKGKRVLVKLHKTMGVEYQDKPALSQNIMSAVKGNDEDLDKLRKVLVEAIDEEKTRGQRHKKRQIAMEDARAQREMMLGQLDLKKALNEDDGARDYAAEEGLEPDGFAEHHQHINESTPLDMSRSEFWSSFSSSEEALLECSGLILNLPLSAHARCRRGVDDGGVASRANALTYRVPANGYYFFIFNSENEVQTNFIRARFDLQKTRYDAARALRECKNTTDRCDLMLDMFSGQKVVLEVPLRDNDSLWNEQFVIISECEPRTSIYLFCVIIVPVLILVFSFQ